MMEDPNSFPNALGTTPLSPATDPTNTDVPEPSPKAETPAEISSTEPAGVPASRGERKPNKPVSHAKKEHKGPPVPAHVRNEKEGELFFSNLGRKIKSKGGKFVRNVGDARGSFLILGSRRFDLSDDEQISHLLLSEMNCSSLSLPAKIAVQRLRWYASQSQNSLRLAYFSAMSGDGNEVYVPLAGGEILAVGANGIRVLSEVPGDIWVRCCSPQPTRD
jgi:hypothetical protein